MTHARRIIVTGPIGAGKSTFAAGLSRAMGIPHIELDPIYIGLDGWLPENREALRQALQDQFDAYPRGWVVDGGQRQALQFIVTQADTLIWLHFGAHVVFPRLVRRTIARHRAKRLTVRDLAPRRSPIAWGAALWRMHQREVRTYIRQRRPGMRVVVLRSPKDAARYLAEVGRRAPVG